MGENKAQTADDTGQSAEGVAAPDGADAPASEQTENEPSGLSGVLRRAWQAPLLIAAGAFLAAGLFATFATAPKPEFEPWLDRAEKQIELESYDESIATLNDEVYPYLDDPAMEPESRARFHKLLARSIYLGQFDLGMDLRANNENIATEYAIAREMSADLTTRDEFYIADTMIRLGRVEEAVAIADGLPGGEATRKREIYRRSIRKLLGPPELDRAVATDLLAQLAEDSGLPIEDRVWVAATQTEIRLLAGFPGEAIDQLLRTVPRLRAATPEQMAVLYVWLADAYQQLPEPDYNASLENLGRAEAILTSGNQPLLAKVHLLSARARLAQPDTGMQELEEARDRLALINDQFKSTQWRLPALQLVGEIEADLGDHGESLSAFEELVSELEIGRTGEGLTREGITESLLSLHLARMSAMAHDQALQYAKLAERLNADSSAGDVPDGVVLALGRANKALADELAPDDGDPFTSAGLFELDPATRRQAGRYLRAAGAYYRDHADRMAISDNQGFGDSLWLAADCFDRAGERQLAIAGFQLYADSFPADQRQAEARYRLAQAYQALGEYEIAQGYYEGLIADRGDPFGEKGVGPFADASYVPLAQCLLLDGETSNDSEAERLLTQVVRGRLGGTRQENFRHAVVELGRLYYQAAAFPRAIERFEEAVDRYPDDASIHSIKFMLADSYRQAARALGERLRAEAMPDSEEQLLRKERDERLKRALVLFSEVRDGLETVDPRRRTPIESLNLQHSYYYLGDCAFDLGDYATAIRHYDSARERFPSSPSSLVAMVQIVNCYVELGDMQRARTADQRARRFFEGLPADALDDPNLPMTRRDWERWLDSTSRLYALGAQDGG